MPLINIWNTCVTTTTSVTGQSLYWFGTQNEFSNAFSSSFSNTWSSGTVTLYQTGTATVYYRDIATGQYYVYPNYQTQTPMVVPPPRPPPLARPAILRTPGLGLGEAQRVLDRSIALYRRVRGRSELERFLSGEEIIIQGTLFAYSIKRKGDLLTQAMRPDSVHIPYFLRLLHRRTLQLLADGCVVIPDTPVLDQIIAVVAHIDNIEEEQMLLQRTNWTPSQTMAIARRIVAVRGLGIT